MYVTYKCKQKKPFITFAGYETKLLSPVSSFIVI